MNRDAQVGGREEWRGDGWKNGMTGVVVVVDGGVQTRIDELGSRIITKAGYMRQQDELGVWTCWT